AESRDEHARAERRLPRQHRKIQVDITALRLEERVRRKPDDRVEIAALAAAHCGTALRGQANPPPVRDAGRDAHVQRSRAVHESAGGIELGNVDRQRLRRPAVGLLERQGDGRLVVLAASRERERPRSARTEAFAGQGLEEVAETAGAAGSLSAADMSMLVPVRRRPKRLPRPPVRADRVIGGPRLGVAQHLVSFSDLLEALLRVRFLADVRMVLARETAIGPLDLVLSGVAGDAHDLVVILVLHTALARRRAPGTCGERWGFRPPESSPKAHAFPNLALQAAEMRDQDPLRRRKLASLLLFSCVLAAPSVLAHGITGDDQAILLRASGAHVGPYMYLGAKHMVTG